MVTTLIRSIDTVLSGNELTSESKCVIIERCDVWRRKPMK